MLISSKALQNSLQSGCSLWSKRQDLRESTLQLLFIPSCSLHACQQVVDELVAAAVLLEHGFQGVVQGAEVRAREGAICTWQNPSV